MIFTSIWLILMGFIVGSFFEKFVSERAKNWTWLAIDTALIVGLTVVLTMNFSWPNLALVPLLMYMLGASMKHHWNKLRKGTDE